MLLIRNARLLTMAPGPAGETRGDLLIDGDRIAAVGEVPASGDHLVLDVDGAYVAPGFIDCHCHVGIVPEEVDWEYSDVNETTSPVTGHAQALDGVDLDDVGFVDALEGGVTTLLIHPGSSNVVGGTSVALKSGGKERIVRNPAAIKMAWSAAGRSGRFKSSDLPYPTTRMGVSAILRTLLLEARDYRDGKLAKVPEGIRKVTLDLLVRALNQELQLCVHSMTPIDITAIMRLQDEFGFAFSVHHGDEAHLLASQLAARQVPVVFGPFLGDRRLDVFRHSDPRAVARLLEAGVTVALQTDHPVISIRDLRHQAGLLVRYGLDPYLALRTVTVLPARILGFSDRLGSLEPGKQADFSIFSGHPLSTLSRVEQVYISGQRVL